MTLLSESKIKTLVNGKEKEELARISRNTYYKYKNSIKNQYTN